MSQPPPKGPTDAELTILASLWEHGPGTVREIHERLTPTRPMGYTTVLKFLQIMTLKGLVVRSGDRPSTFAPAHREEDTQRQLVRELMDRAFRGSAHRLMVQALSARKATPEELDAIRAFLDHYDGEQR